MPIFIIYINMSIYICLHLLHMYNLAINGEKENKKIKIKYQMGLN